MYRKTLFSAPVVLAILNTLSSRTLSFKSLPTHRYQIQPILVLGVYR
jgi:hypothetical protein